MSVSPLLKDFKRERLAEYDLYAMETVAMDEKKKMLIQVTPDPNHKSDAYLKLYNSFSKSKATKVARISLYSPTYVLHKHVERMAEKDDWFLTAKEKTDFIEFLKSHTKHEPLYTVWQKTILAYNKELDLFEEQTKENLLPNLKHPDFLPFTLPIPNYSYL
ncbi:hypothetical protein [uncultured Parasutterella sp.]|uniref:hypothetical protein n=1 Tax=uncultured Parasutterella sp. TaxID=1263098 RepID=UPI00272B2DE7|nr:hypothetical protein [uncultured Parasutterella sp.]